MQKSRSTEADPSQYWGLPEQWLAPIKRFKKGVGDATGSSLGLAPAAVNKGLSCTSSIPVAVKTYELKHRHPH